MVRLSRRSLVPLLALVAVALATGCAAEGDDAAAPPAPAPAPAPAEAPAPATTADDSSAQERRAESDGPGRIQDTEFVAAAIAEFDVTAPRIIQSASINLAVEEGEFEPAISRARTAARAAGGFVTSSSAKQAKDEKRLVRGTLVVRVPFLSYATVMSQIAELGTVEAREENGQDVSQQFVDLEARARHLGAVEAQLLGFLEAADSIGDALTVQSRLNDVQLQLEQIRGQLRFLSDQTEFATVSIAIAERGLVPADPGPPDNDWGIVDAWETAAEGFVKVAGGVFVGVATAAPILGPLLAALVVWRLLLRRRNRQEEVTVAAPASPEAATES